MRSFIFLAGIVWTFFAFVFSYFAFSKGVTGGFAMVAGQFALVWGPPLLIGAWMWKLIKENTALQDEMLKACGVSRHSRLVFFVEDSGIAINPAEKKFTLMQDGLYKTYSFDEIRGYRTFYQPTGNSLRGLASTSGLFMTVVCDRRREWHIPMLYQSDQERWAQIIQMEILDVAEAA